MNEVPPLAPLPLVDRFRSNVGRTPLFFLATAFFGSISLLASLIEKDGRRQHRIARKWAQTSLWIAGAEVSVIGRENLRPLAVYASNHASFMDTPVVFASLAFQFRILAKQSLWKWPFIGWHLHRSGQIPVEGETKSGSIAGLNLAIRALKDGMPLFIFPEGGRTQDGSLQPFLRGPAFIAIRARAPLVPIALIGTYELLPPNTHHFRPNRVKLVIGAPIDSVGYTIRQADELTLRLRTEIGRLCHAYADPENAAPGNADTGNVHSGSLSAECVGVVQRQEVNEDS